MASNDDRRITRLSLSWELVRAVLQLPDDTELLAVEASDAERQEVTVVIRQKSINPVPRGSDIPNVMALFSKKPLFDGWIQPTPTTNKCLVN